MKVKLLEKIITSNIFTQEEIEFLNNQKREEEQNSVEYEDSRYQGAVYNNDEIDNKTQYASSLSDLLEMNDFKFDDEQHDF